MVERKYLNFAAYVQVIGIILVVLFHSLHQYPDGFHDTYTRIYGMLYSIAMPLFMFISGYLMVLSTELRPRPFRRFAVQKMRRLLLPFVVLSLITFVPRSYMSGLADDALEMSWMSLGRSLLFSDGLVIPYLWYLQALFVLLLGAFGVLSVCRARGIRPEWAYGMMILAVVVLELVPVYVPTFFSLDMAAIMAVYFVGGSCYGHWQRAVDGVVPWTCLWFPAAMLIIWIVLYEVKEPWGRFGTIMCSFAGIAMVISLAKIFEVRRVGVLDHLSGATYLIFLLSWYFNVLCQQVLAHYVDLPWWVHTLLSLVAGIYVPWLYYRFSRRHAGNRVVKVLNYLLGQ